MAGPMEEMTRGQESGIHMHMPGHKGRFPTEWLRPWADTTELSKTDDLFAPTGAILRAQRLAARAAGAKTAQMLTGGATSGNLAMLLYALEPGQPLILPRNAHVSVISACILAGVEPIYVWPRSTAEGLYPIPSEDVLAAIQSHPQARAVLVTRPDYYGLCPELEPIVRACRDREMRLLVDEAHGAHFNWTAFGPASAGALGADLWVQSAHKTLPALTGAAWLFARQEIAGALRQCLRLVHSSSPSFLVLQSLDAARDWMDREGEAALEELRRRIRMFWRRVESSAGLVNAHTGAPQPVDSLRLVVDVSGRGWSGHEAMAELGRRGIYAEMADERRVVMIPTVWDRPEDLEHVARALVDLPPRTAAVPRGHEPPGRPVQGMHLRQAALGRHREIPLREAKGRFAAAAVGLYPPGIPQWMPGERIDAPELSAFQRQLELGAQPFGLMNGRMPCVDEEELCGTMPIASTWMER